MNVISNSNMSKIFSKIDEYRMDMGIAIVIDDSKRGKDYASGGKWAIKDKVIKTYFDNVGTYVNRVGRIGTLLFYVDYGLSDNDIFILENDKMYKFKYDGSNIRNFLSTIIMDVINGTVDEYEKLTVTEEEDDYMKMKYMSSEELSEYLSKKSKG